ncbi:MAG: T9SS type A sorting domain-containing protein [Polaribacter sp.]|uniref:T9SS type A sorting domain-containing protein n=1 Tax=Polaribacter sp. TaxID=1920175 RepID=UPI002F350178
MTQKFSPEFLRHLIVLTIIFQSFNLFSQNVDITVSVSWPSWSSENKIELLGPSNDVIFTIDNGYDGRNVTGTYTESKSTNPDVAVNSSTTTGYSVKMYDSYGDGWNGSGTATVNVDGVDVLNLNSSNFDDITNSSNTEIIKEIHFAVNQVVVLDNASFSYTKASYCQIESDPTATVTGEAGGTFTSTSGLIINSSSGLIDVSASTLGSYVVTYTTTAPDQNSATQNITISNGDVATFEYTRSKSVQDSADLTPTTTGVSGAFSSTSGLSINSSSGLIDVSNSTIGVYTVSYTTTTGSCPKIYTDEVEILAPFPGVSQYFNSSKKYIEYIPGNMPVIISAPHGGVLQAGSEDCCLSSSTYPHTDSDLNIRNCGSDERDDNTDILIREIQKRSYEQYGLYPHIIINNLHRSKLDPNRDRAEATCNSTGADKYYDAFHNFIDTASADVDAKFGKGLYIDLHGQSHSVPRIEAGYNLPSSSFDENLNNAATNAEELSRVTIKNLIENNLQNLSFEDLIRGSQSLGGLFQTTGGSEYLAISGNTTCSKTAGYRTVPSHISSGSSQGTCDDTNPGNNDYFAGDYYNNIRHGSGSTSKSNSIVGAGGNLNGGGGTIDGIMTEVNRRVRDIGSDYSSFSYPYNRTDGRTATVPHFSRDYGTVIKTYIDLHYNDFSKFTYDATSYSTKGIDVTPTINGISGGTFSSTSGLSINTSTGEIDVSNSTTGTYTISYTAPNVGDYYKKETEITINNATVTNEFTANSGDWSLTTNWSLARIPLAIDNVSIPLGKTANLNLTNVSVIDVTVAGVLNVNAGKSLTLTGNLTTTGTTKIKSDATSSGSLIVDGTSTGNISYDRYIKDNTNWYLISSPVENQDIDVFANASSLILGAGENRGLGAYNNATPGWDYYQNGATTSGDFNLGKGYTIRLSSAENTTFTGSLKTDNSPADVTVGSNGWNLIGNPYPSFMNLNDPANATNNVIDINFTKLQSGFKAIYFWDSASTSYKPFNNASSAKYLAPGQGYFVRVIADGTIAMNENMQSHQSGNLFARSGSDRFEIKLKVSNGTSEKSTDIKYINGTTTGLDDGYDAGLFNGSSNSFALYTHLVTENDGIKYALQALPDSNFNEMIIPIGVNAVANSEITINADVLNIPNGLKVYLEDKDVNTFTRIDEANTSYKVTLTSDLNSDGRFYIHTSSGVLSVKNEEIASNLNVYKTDNRTLKITGLKDEKSLIKLFTVLGKKVFHLDISNQTSQEIKLPRLLSGVYLIQLETSSQKISKKIILE